MWPTSTGASDPSPFRPPRRVPGDNCRCRPMWRAPCATIFGIGRIPMPPSCSWGTPGCEGVQAHPGRSRRRWTGPALWFPWLVWHASVASFLRHQTSCPWGDQKETDAVLAATDPATRSGQRDQICSPPFTTPAHGFLKPCNFAPKICATAPFFSGAKVGRTGRCRCGLGRTTAAALVQNQQHWASAVDFHQSKQRATQS